MNKQILLISSAALVLTGSITANAASYLTDSSGQVVRNNYTECWHTPFWTPEQAIEGCDGMVKKAEPVAMADGDADNDGVADSKDKCPGTPANTSVDAQGCTSDADGDGVADNADRCPGTAAGTRVDARGCALDSDGDGVADASDKCPGTAAGVQVDATGCDINRDDDGDGIANSADQCAGTPKGTAVDKTGCELKQAAIALDDVQFATGTAVLGAQSQAILNNVADVLKANPHLKFEVAGHTDNTGSYQANVALSESRAASVRQYLVDQGVAADRLTAKGYGPDKPVADNATRQGRQANRRVELVLQ